MSDDSGFVALGHYPQFMVVTRFRPSSLQGKLRDKEKQTKHRRQQITRQESLDKLINRNINKSTCCVISDTSYVHTLKINKTGNVDQRV